MTHCADMLRTHDGRIAKLIEQQNLDPSDSRYGGVWRPDFDIEPRTCGFHLSEILWGYLTPRSRWYKDERAAAAISALLVYAKNHQRPDGCFDLSSCNFASPPDTAFMVNCMLNGWWLLEKAEDADFDWLRQPMLDIMDKAADGIAAGGFHTPNHRWAIAACLLSLEKIFRREALGSRARQYLNEGLDINEDGEFAERSSGGYNMVNDDQMIRLYLATGNKKFLEAAAANLEMMYCYFDPDNSIFTNNSTRQDMGRKSFAEGYYILYLLVGYLLGREDLGRMAGWLWREARSRGVTPEGIEWILLMPEMDGWAEDDGFEPPIREYNRLFPGSDIARIRKGDWSVSLMKGKANFLYFQHKSFTVYAVIYANLCDRRNFLADTLEKTENGYIMKACAESWYYLPYAEPPATSDWWAMDCPNTRERINGVPLETTVEVVLQEDGIDLHLKTEGVERLPLRMEFAFQPGGYVRTEHFVQNARAGEQINIIDGMVEASGARGETILLGPAFSEHHNTGALGGAYPLSMEHYTVYCTGYTPVDRVIRLRAARRGRCL